MGALTTQVWRLHMHHSRSHCHADRLTSETQSPKSTWTSGARALKWSRLLSNRLALDRKALHQRIRSDHSEASRTSAEMELTSWSIVGNCQKTSTACDCNA